MSVAIVRSELDVVEPDANKHLLYCSSSEALLRKQVRSIGAGRVYIASMIMQVWLLEVHVDRKGRGALGSVELEERVAGSV